MKEEDIWLLIASIVLTFFFLGAEFFAVLTAGEMVVEKIQEAIAFLRGLPLF